MFLLYKLNMFSLAKKKYLIITPSTTQVVMFYNFVIQTDTLIDHGSISITEADKRMNPTMSLKEYYTVYIIETK